MPTDKPPKAEKCFLTPEELPVEEKYYKPDLEISDRFQAYSAELLRVSLAGVVIVGYFYEKLYLFLDFKQSFWNYFTVRDALIWSLLFLASSSALALAHRYFTSNSMSYHLSYIRYEVAAQNENSDTCRKESLHEKANIEKGWRYRNLKGCERLLSASATALGLGTFCLVLGFAYGLRDAPIESDKPSQTVAIDSAK